MNLSANRRIRRELLGDDSTWIGRIVNVNGSATVSGEPLHCYVQKNSGGQPLVIYNDATPHQAGRRVVVGYDRRDRRRRVMRGLYTAGMPQTVNPNVGAHAPSHLEGGSDQVWVTTNQILNGLVFASSGMTVSVNPGWIVCEGQVVRLALSTLDLTAHIPVAGACYVLIRADSAGAISAQAGTAVDSLADLTDADIPRVVAGYTLLGFARLYEGQTALNRTVAGRDVWDVRLATREYHEPAADFRHQVLFTVSGDVETHTGVLLAANHTGRTLTIVGVYLDCVTAPTGAAIIVDIHKDGTTIFTEQAHRPQIAAGADAGNTTTIDAATWADGEVLTMDVDQAGSTVPGANMTVTVVYL
jgi:hypothetical protein